ncbi:Uncharacterized protein TCM_005710 [Theobroma cacao]|uniref:Uncharacterized protein n=1 Tax=Theobroma cacao TaxID=3641 RepID=A0A061DUJ2_THECC|nr:Uncharacterized protein TCM_005710 [Theobroma cacao]
MINLDPHLESVARGIWEFCNLIQCTAMKPNENVKVRKPKNEKRLDIQSRKMYSPLGSTLMTFWEENSSFIFFGLPPTITLFFFRLFRICLGGFVDACNTQSCRKIIPLYICKYLFAALVISFVYSFGQEACRCCTQNLFLNSEKKNLPRYLKFVK